jgi:Family of unknown function (DUF6152)
MSMSMSRKLCMAMLGVGLLLATGPVLAHHAFSAEFDGNHPVKLDGAITKVELINPHAWIHMSVKSPDGKVEEWMVEGGTPNTLMRRGITRDSLRLEPRSMWTATRPRTGASGPTGGISRSRTAASCSWARRAPAPPATHRPNLASRLRVNCRIAGPRDRPRHTRWSVSPACNPA